ncbi:MAG TPA: DUF3606 domain-containing protein [Roseateles sp.]|uniref:DUF3606 domain-containing protein n=1 Tax=Roseateles sp. TaxID=1971397 RepID=UPI002ED97098
MADDKSSPGGHGGSRIKLSDDDELRDWAARFSVSVERLREAVLLVGDHADAVERYLKDGTR